jgi:hypothetical protein
VFQLFQDSIQLLNGPDEFNHWNTWNNWNEWNWVRRRVGLYLRGVINNEESRFQNFLS